MSFCLQQYFRWASLVFRESPIYEIFKLALHLKICFLTFVVVDVMAPYHTFIMQPSTNCIALSQLAQLTQNSVNLRIFYLQPIGRWRRKETENCLSLFIFYFCFIKQKTLYFMNISEYFAWCFFMIFIFS